jgi:fido (protein-threonine AMPylation protein)
MPLTTIITIKFQSPFWGFPGAPVNLKNCLFIPQLKYYNAPMKNTDSSKVKKQFFQLKEIRDSVSITQKDIATVIRFENAVHSSIMEYDILDPAFIRTVLYRGNIRVKEHFSPIYRKIALEVIGLDQMLRHLEKTAPKKTDLSVSLVLKAQKMLFEYSWPDIAGRYRDVDVRIKGLKLRPPHPSQVSSMLYQHLGWVDGLMKLVGPVSESNFFEVFHVAADLHYRIIEAYPFLSGNWRLARAFSNYVLQNSGMFPMIIDSARRDDYMMAVNESSLTKLEPLVNFFVESYGETMERVKGFLALVQKETE